MLLDGGGAVREPVLEFPRLAEDGAKLLPQEGEEVLLVRLELLPGLEPACQVGKFRPRVDPRFRVVVKETRKAAMSGFEDLSGRTPSRSM